MPKKHISIRDLHHSFIVDNKRFWVFKGDEKIIISELEYPKEDVVYGERRIEISRDEDGDIIARWGMTQEQAKKVVNSSKVDKVRNAQKASELAALQNNSLRINARRLNLKALSKKQHRSSSADRSAVQSKVATQKAQINIKPRDTSGKEMSTSTDKFKGAPVYRALVEIANKPADGVAVKVFSGQGIKIRKAERSMFSMRRRYGKGDLIVRQENTKGYMVVRKDGSIYVSDRLRRGDKGRSIMQQLPRPEVARAIGGVVGRNIDYVYPATVMDAKTKTYDVSSDPTYDMADFSKVTNGAAASPPAKYSIGEDYQTRASDYQRARDVVATKEGPHDYRNAAQVRGHDYRDVDPSQMVKTKEREESRRIKKYLDEVQEDDLRGAEPSGYASIIQAAKKFYETLRATPVEERDGYKIQIGISRYKAESDSYNDKIYVAAIWDLEKPVFPEKFEDSVIARALTDIVVTAKAQERQENALREQRSSSPSKSKRASGGYSRGGGKENIRPGASGDSPDQPSARRPSSSVSKASSARIYSGGPFVEVSYV